MCRRRRRLQLIRQIGGFTPAQDTELPVPVAEQHPDRGIGRDSPRVIFNHTTRYNNELDLELYDLLLQGEDSGNFLERTGRRDLMRYRTDAFDDNNVNAAKFF